MEVYASMLVDALAEDAFVQVRDFQSNHAAQMTVRNICTWPCAVANLDGSVCVVRAEDLQGMVREMSDAAGATSGAKSGAASGELGMPAGFTSNCLLVVAGGGSGSMLEGVNLSGELSKLSANSKIIFGNLMLAPDGLSVGDAVSDIANRMSQIIDWRIRVAELRASHAGLSEFLPIVAEPLKNPVALFAGDGSLVQTAGTMDGDATGTIWDHLDKGFVGLGFYTVDDRRIMARSMSNPSECMKFNPQADPEHTYCCGFIGVGNDIYASLGLVDINSPITDGQLKAFGIMRNETERFLRENQQYMSLYKGAGIVLRELLSGTSMPSHDVEQWLSDNRISSNRGYILLDIPKPGAIPQDSISKNPKMPADATPAETISQHEGCNRSERAVRFIPMLLERELHDIFKDCVICTLDGEVVVLVPARSDLDDQERIIADSLRKFDVSWGMSPRFKAFSNMQSRLEQARFAASFASSDSSASDDSNSHGRFERCFIEFAFSSLERAGVGEQLVDPSLQDIWQASDRGREDIEQLAAYLSSGRNYAAASRKLYMHRNSLIYRIRKISEELGCDFETVDDDLAAYYLVGCEYLIKLGSGKSSGRS